MLKGALIAAALLTATSADAEPRRVLTMARVPIGDLDLSTPQGARVMLRRLSAAASELCAYTPTPVLPRASAQAWRCRREAMSQAVERLNTREIRLAYSELLTAEPPARP